MSFFFFVGGQYQYILVDKKGEKKNVGFIQLNRPKALNALCDGLMLEVGKALDTFEQDTEVGAVVITGSERAFAGMQHELRPNIIWPFLFNCNNRGLYRLQLNATFV